MIETLNKIKVLTRDILNEFNSHNSRSDLIEKYEHFIENRENLIQQVNGPYTSEEMSLGKEILKLDQELQKKVNEFFNAVTSDYELFMKKKTYNKKYSDIYKAAYMNDGAYIDKKK